jgi:hypothetical protein
LVGFLTLSGGIFARFALRRAASPLTTQQQPQNLTLSKEYIYAGGRLVATEQPPPTSSCTPSPDVNVIIREFRFRGPQGATDEFIEIYNATNSSVSVCATDGSTGWTLATRSAEGAPIELTTIPNGTSIPSRGHYLIVGGGYSLGTNAQRASFASPTPLAIVQKITQDPIHLTSEDVQGAITATGYIVNDLPTTITSYVGRVPGLLASTTSLTRLTANGNGAYSTDITDNAGVALFSTSNPVNFTAERRLDAVGFSNMSGPNAELYRDGSGLPPISGDGEYSFVRKVSAGTGYFPQDTNNNASDFWFISTTGGTFGGVVSILGAPSPENLSSPRQRFLGFGWLDPSVPYNSAPNWVRCQACTGPYATYGTLALRLTFTNNTGETITRFRIRAYDITTLNSPGYIAGGGQADVRLLSSSDTTATMSDGSTVTVRGTTVEVPPDQPNGGGLNTSLLLPLDEAGLPPGQRISVQFLLGIQQSGYFRFFAVMEALP